MFCCSKSVQGSQSAVAPNGKNNQAFMKQRGREPEQKGGQVFLFCLFTLQGVAGERRDNIRLPVAFSSRSIPFPFRFSRLPQICPGSGRLMSRMIFIIAIPECPHAPKVTEILIIRSIRSTMKMTNNLVKLYFF